MPTTSAQTDLLENSPVFDLSPEDRRILAETALHGDALTLRRVLNQMLGKVRGKISTDRKAAAARQNGKRGGRPRKVAASEAGE